MLCALQKTSQGLYSVSLSEVLIVDLSAVQELSEVCEEFHADCCLLLLGGTSLVRDLPYLITETLFAAVSWALETVGASFLAGT